MPTESRFLFDGLDRDDYRPEGEHQYDEAEAKHKGEDDWSVNVYDVEEVGRLSGYAADVNLSGNPLEGVGNMHLAESSHLFGRGAAVGLTRERNRQECEIAGVIDLRRGRDRKDWVLLKRLHETRHRLLHLRTLDIAVYDDLRRTEDSGRGDIADGEFFFEEDERLLGLRSVGEGVDVV